MRCAPLLLPLKIRSRIAKRDPFSELGAEGLWFTSSLWVRRSTITKEHGGRLLLSLGGLSWTKYYSPPCCLHIKSHHPKSHKGSAKQAVLPVCFPGSKDCGNQRHVQEKLKWTQSTNWYDLTDSFSTPHFAKEIFTQFRQTRSKTNIKSIQASIIYKKLTTRSVTNTTFQQAPVTLLSARKRKEQYI